MPLPTGNIEWPPPELGALNKLYNEYAVWYNGDPDELVAHYAAYPGLDGAGLGAELPKGQVQSAKFTAQLIAGGSRKFWGAPPSIGQVRSHKTHIPLPADIAATGADLLYAEPPTAKIAAAQGSVKGATADGVVATNPTQKALDDIHEAANHHAVLLQSGEIGCVYGGSFIRVQWDPVVSEKPIYDVLTPDVAVPEFRSGRLVAVTLWKVLPSPDSATWRHLERHEPGRVLHGLWRSTDEGKLGARLALAAHPATAPFTMLVDAGSKDTITTGATGLAVEYIPAMLPNRDRRWPNIGRSDYAGVMGLFDMLDEAWTSWLRDLRIGKGRIVVPRSYLNAQGRGRGAVFDPEREVYEAVDALGAGGAGGSGQLALQVVQFAIRVAEHSQTCREISVRAQASAGYSPQTFGDADQVAATATEVVERNAASFRKRARMITYARGPLARLDRTALEIYAAKLGAKGLTPDLPVVNWPDGVAQDPNVLAQTLQLLAAAEAASIETRVKMLNPDWEPPEVKAEVVKIKEEQAAAHPSPVAPPGSGPAGLDDLGGGASSGSDSSGGDSPSSGPQPGRGPLPVRPGPR